MHAGHVNEPGVTIGPGPRTELGHSPSVLVLDENVSHQRSRVGSIATMYVPKFELMGLSQDLFCWNCFFWHSPVYELHEQSLQIKTSDGSFRNLMHRGFA